MSEIRPGSGRDFVEVLLGYGLIMLAIWTPDLPQRVLSPVAFFVTLTVVLLRGRSLRQLGLGRSGLWRSFWILPAAMALSVMAILTAKQLGTLHPLYKGDFEHVAGYVLWTLYQQFLLNDYFVPRLARWLESEAAAVGLSAVLFATAHLPSVWLTIATLVWGTVSCALFLRYRNLYALGLAQGLLGICFAVSIPDAVHHHLRVGLGYLRYRP